MSSSTDTYAFASMDLEELGGEMKKRIDQYFEYTLRNGILTLWASSFHQYNVGFFTGGRIVQTGEQAEISNISVNNYRNILQHIKIQATNVKPNWQVRAENPDYKSITEAVLAPGLLDHYLNNGGLEKAWKMAAEYATTYGISWLESKWDDALGRQLMHDESRNLPIYEGDLRYVSYTPIDVVYDIMNRTSEQRNRWLMLREWRNKYDMAALHPEAADEIIATKSFNENDRYEYLFYFYRWNTDMIKDMVPCWTFYHEKCPSIPQGRIIQLVGDDLIVSDEPLQTERIPVARICPSMMDRSNIGYTVGFDLLGLQKGNDICYSSMLTNISTFAVNNVSVMKGTDLNPATFAGGLNLIEYNSPQGKPEVLNMSQMPDTIPNFYHMGVSQMETISAINATVRGNPESNIESAKALAMMSSQSIQFTSDFQEECINALAETGKNTLDVLSVRATTERIVDITGKIPGQYVTSFKGDQLKGIRHVDVDVSNPLMRTTEGRAEMASQLIQMKLIKDPKQFLQLLATGQLESLVGADVMENNNIVSENEIMLAGQDPIVIRFDNHPKHINSHMALLSTPDARKNKTLVDIIFKHTAEHMEVWRAAPQDVLEILGIPPLPGTQPGGPPGGPGMQPNQPPGPGGEMKLPPPPGGSEASAQLPKNPMTGQRFNPQNGGGMIPPH